MWKVFVTSYVLTLASHSLLRNSQIIYVKTCKINKNRDIIVRYRIDEIIRGVSCEGGYLVLK
jgi:hypothetical protein